MEKINQTCWHTSNPGNDLDLTRYITITKMINQYKFSATFFTGVTLFLFLGFFFTYFLNFSQFKWIHHAHGTLFFVWMFIMIAQPLLVVYHKQSIHRFIGKLSYFIFPLLLLSIHVVGKNGYHNILSTAGKEVATGGLSLSIANIPPLALLYFLAIKNRKITALHMRYMIAISVFLLGPGIGRAIIVLGQFPFPVGVSITNVVLAAVSGILLVVDLVRSKPYKPYLIAFLLNLLMLLIWERQMDGWWQTIGVAYAKLFF